ncbi:MAG: DUF222 domain-containing protein [Deltaproteobacteria bacterium]|nr:MAG: DUF222 domain-containing protein [Deltaproteobacteria bacterium]TMQ11338.1 MAG: DUF222 domain-containing protein [Deltaproteobacteria bacterium]
MDCEIDQLGDRIAEQAAHLDAATLRLLSDLREFDKRGGWREQGTTSCAHWLTWRVGWDLVTARDRVRVARKLAEFAAIDDALRRGEVSYSKVRAMLRAATPENESLLLEYARLMTASQLEKLARKYALARRHSQNPNPLVDQQRRYVRRRDTEDGMVKIEAVLHPEEAEMVWAMLDHAAAELARTPGTSTEHDSTGSLASRSASQTTVVTVQPPERHPDHHHDSAESPTPFAMPGASPASAPRAALHDHCHDSAESPNPFAVPRASPISSLPADHAPDRHHDSAESPTRFVAGPVGPVSGLPTTLAPDHCHDSAESPTRFVAGPVGLASGLPTVLAPDHHHDSAESPPPAESSIPCCCDADSPSSASEPSARSLLDRLLDEADALRWAEEASCEETNALAETDAAQPTVPASVTARG